MRIVAESLISTVLPLQINCASLKYGNGKVIHETYF